MAIFHTNSNDTTTSGESFFKVLIEKYLDDSFHIWNNIQYYNELDFLILNKDLGLLIIEIKDWTIDNIESVNDSLVRANLYNSPLQNYTNPFKKLTSNINDIRNTISKNKSLLHKSGKFENKLKFTINSVVVFTNITSDEFKKKDFIGPSKFPVDQMITASDIKHIGRENFMEILASKKRLGFKNQLSAVDIDKIVNEFGTITDTEYKTEANLNDQNLSISEKKGLKKNKNKSKKAKQKDYTNLSQKELIIELSLIIENNPIQKIKNEVEDIRSEFYFKFKEELENDKKQYLFEGKNIIDYYYTTPIKKEFDTLFYNYKLKRNEYLKTLSNDLRANLNIRIELIEELKKLINSNGNTNSIIKCFNDINKKWHMAGEIPRDKYNTVWNNYHYQVENFNDILHLDREFAKRNNENKLKQKVSTSINKKVKPLKTNVKSIRLIKVLREFNISLDRAIEFLESKGHIVGSQPTTVINNKEYQILIDEFQTDESIKVNEETQSEKGE